MSLMARVLVLVGIALTPGLLILAYNELDFRRERTRQIETTALRQAELINGDIGSIIEGIRQLSIAIASSDAVLRLDAACVQELQRIHRQQTSYKALSVF